MKIKLKPLTQFHSKDDCDYTILVVKRPPAALGKGNVTAAAKLEKVKPSPTLDAPSVDAETLFDSSDMHRMMNRQMRDMEHLMDAMMVDPFAMMGGRMPAMGYVHPRHQMIAEGAGAQGHTSRYDIWRSAYPRSVKSCRNHF